MSKFRPMKGYSLEEKHLPNLRYPLIAQPKLDGIRCCIVEGSPLTYSLKKIPNKYIREKLRNCNAGLALVDGELILRDNNATFQQTVSAVMSEDGEPDFMYVTFDYLFKLTDNTNKSEEYQLRLNYETFDRPYIKRIETHEFGYYDSVERFEKDVLERGYEGIILRGPTSLYKFGRSTLKEQGMLKLKRFTDAEAQIIGFEELMINGNEQTINEHGLAERNSEQDGLIPGNTLGALVVRGINGKFKGVEFKIGSGFTQEERENIWRYKKGYINLIVTYKFQDHNCKDKPRQPIWKGFRKDI